MLVALLGQAGVASAATTPNADTAGHAATTRPATSAGGSQKQHRTPPPVPAKPRPGVRLTTKPVAPAKSALPAPPRTGAQLAARTTARAAAVRTALANAQTVSSCSGAIVAGTVYSCTTPSATGTDSYTLTLGQATDLLAIRAYGSGGSQLPFTVAAPDSTVLNCAAPNWSLPPQCHTSQAGTYTVAVQNSNASYTLAFLPLLSDAGCTTVDPSFTAPTLQGSLDASAVGDCYRLPMASGHVLRADAYSPSNGSLAVTVYDATGTQICSDTFGDCTLTGTAPYSVLVDDANGNVDSYDLQLNDVTQPQGCAATAQGVYGAAPDLSGADRCRTLQVTAPGLYQVYAASTDQQGLGGTLYKTDGTLACTNSGPTCQLAAGSYDFVVSPWLGGPAHFGVVFISASESRGCASATDTGFSTGPATGAFSGAGEEICLTLPTASGLSDYFFDQPTADGSAPQAQVVDATGAQQCPNATFSYATCPLAGTAPFRVLLSGQPAKGGYRLLAQRTDSQTGCRAWPQSGFGSSYGATASLTPSADVACFAIPANAHSTGEMIDYSNTSNVVNGATYVNDPTGQQVCSGNSTGFCSYRTGVAYTALLITVSPKPETYHLVRRDVSRTAACATPASTVPGGPSTTLLLGSDLDSRCLRVTAAVGDKLALGVRTSALTQAGAVLQVADPNGTILCWQHGPTCEVTGQTSYQVLVTAANYQGVSITAHVDTWRVGTASGWASQCTAHPLDAATGWKPITASLSEAAAGYCAVVAVQPSQRFWLYTAGASSANQPVIGMQSAAGWGVGWSQAMGLCNGVSGTSIGCQTASTDPAGQDVMVLFPYLSALPLSLTFQGACDTNCAARTPYPQVTGVTPASGPSGGLNTVVVHGQNLNLATRIDLAQNGMNAANYAITVPVSLSGDATALTVRLNTRGVAPGTYDVVQDGVGYSVGTPSPGYLPGAYRVTAGPSPVPAGTFVPLNPSRVLDTRTGLGAPKARVAPGHLVRLLVDGVAHVPTAGVTSVVLSVTAAAPTRAGALTAYADGTARPQVTDLSFGLGQTATAQVTVPVVNGRVDLYNGSAGTVDLSADLAGYYTSVGNHLRLDPMGPERILDTRTGLGARKAHVAADRAIAVTLAGVGGVPAHVSAVVLNVGALAPAKSGYLAAFGYGQAVPHVSQLTFMAGRSVTGLVTVPVVGGRVDLYNGSAGTVDLTADVVGYYATAGSLYLAVAPVRALDTRTGLGGSGTTVLPHAAAQLNVSNLPNLPNTVTAVVLSVTVTGAQNGGALTVFPDGQPVERLPNVIVLAGQTVTTQVVVPVVNGVVDFYNNTPGNIQVVADLEGYLAS
ncbi:hypothetical protein [Streptacidiphilus neutrinimicus]|uniref:hypothetical protein n=1 Tax=Streptacidiphilus neutrinimicus TaxID=105420 RepID=UPI0005A8E563|nr:hypothetical protein [Streptacidiphilus neutrinimicus]